MLNTRGALYIVSTPIGNLSDITFRAIEVLKNVDLIAAEDTRHSRRLLDNYEVKTRLISIHQHNESERIDYVKQHLEEGKSMALISDAGTPLISDPGYRLVSQLRSDGYEILTIPGPSALIAALSISGLPTDHFYFSGFLSSKSAARKAQLEKLSYLEATSIVYEAPHRLQKLVDDICEVMGPDRKVCLARELTKKFETVKLAKAKDLSLWLSSDPQQHKGECVVMIEPLGAPEKELSFDAETLSLLKAISEHAPPKKAAAIVSDYTGVSKKVLYEALIGTKHST